MDKDFHPEQGSGASVKPKNQVYSKLSKDKDEDFAISISGPEPGAPRLPGKDRNGLPSLEGLRILMVEDNDINQLVTSVFLSNWDIETEIISNGRMVTDRLLKSQFDLIIMDLYLPGMDGYQTTREIRRQAPPEVANIPIIGVSGSKGMEDRYLAFDCGMNDFILKPINPNELYRKIIKYTLEN